MAILNGCFRSRNEMCGTFIFETDKLGNNHERSLSGITQFMTLLEFGRTNNYYRSVGSGGHLIAKHAHEFVKLPSPEEENSIAPHN